MRDVTESDWKLFKKMLPQWQERYMEKLIGQYVEMLNGDSEASSRFWALEELSLIHISEPTRHLRI